MVLPVALIDQRQIGRRLLPVTLDRFEKTAVAQQAPHRGPGVEAAAAQRTEGPQPAPEGFEFRGIEKGDVVAGELEPVQREGIVPLLPQPLEHQMALQQEP